MRIATWNIERPKAQELEKLDAIHERMRLIDADIWILTETNACVSPGPDYQCLQSTPIDGPERYSPGENRTTIWSRFPIRRSLKTHDPETAVCAEVEHAGALVLIYGTIIPYHDAGTRYEYRFEGATVIGKKAWQLHYKSIEHHAEDWQQLREKFPTHSVCVAGDLNQNRDGRRWYGTKEGRKQLGKALADANLTCRTEGEIKPINGGILDPTVDHICVDLDFATRAAAAVGWQPGKTPRGRRLSDHTGVYVDLSSH
jgi:hypothetical protein